MGIPPYVWIPGMVMLFGIAFCFGIARVAGRQRDSLRSVCGVGAAGVALAGILTAIAASTSHNTTDTVLAKDAPGWSKHVSTTLAAVERRTWVTKEGKHTDPVTHFETTVTTASRTRVLLNEGTVFAPGDPIVYFCGDIKWSANDTTGLQCAEASVAVNIAPIHASFWTVERIVWSGIIAAIITFLLTLLAWRGGLHAPRLPVPSPENPDTHSSLMG